MLSLWKSLLVPSLEHQMTTSMPLNQIPLKIVWCWYELNEVLKFSFGQSHSSYYRRCDVLAWSMSRDVSSSWSFQPSLQPFENCFRYIICTIKIFHFLENQQFLVNKNHPLWIQGHFYTPISFSMLWVKNWFFWTIHSYL